MPLNLEALVIQDYRQWCQSLDPVLLNLTAISGLWRPRRRFEILSLVSVCELGL